MSRISATADYGVLKDCDLVIEAVFEDRKVKADTYAKAQPLLKGDAVFASNTSTLPINSLAEEFMDQGKFIGIHFFSPVEKMMLVEIIVGKNTGDVALATALDYTRAIGKTPIVVNDSRGFYTSRVIGTMVNEGLAMLGEGVRPMSVERAATQAGYPVGTLQLSDELNMELMVKIRNATKAAVERDGGTYVPHPAERVIDAMIEAGRPSKLKGAGFYEYADGKRTRIWPGLAELFPPAEGSDSFGADIGELKDRLLFIEAVETARCFDEGVIESSAAANIGSIMGIGYPALTGGAAQFMQGYEGPEGHGLAAFVTRANELADTYGERFRPPAYLSELAEKGERLPA
jgi:3-hydroxyacyl-CoA dehydrogenase/enoyl-CoA hydratase/3-hydroxybutyryl-CoA epimerase